MVNVKKKGNRGENDFANWLRDHGIKAWKDGMSGGGNREKGDVGNNIDCTFEVKTVKRINLKQAWDQADRSATAHKNQAVLAIHFDGMPKGEWLMVMHSEDWLEMMLNGSELAQVESSSHFDKEHDRKLKWAIEGVIRACKALLKLID